MPSPKLTDCGNARQEDSSVPFSILTTADSDTGDSGESFVARQNFTVSSVAIPTNASALPSVDANNQAQISRGDKLHSQNGVVSESAPALPQMSALERADLSFMSGRNFSSDVEAFLFWRNLVETAALLQMMEKR